MITIDIDGEGRTFVHMQRLNWSPSKYKQFRKEALEVFHNNGYKPVYANVPRDMKDVMERLGFQRTGFLTMSPEGVPTITMVTEYEVFANRKRLRGD